MKERAKVKAMAMVKAMALVTLPMVTEKALAACLTAWTTTAAGVKLTKRLRLWLKNA